MADQAGTSPSASADTNNQQRIRDVAMVCFAEHGVSATSLRTIADAADVSVGLIQHYFGSKAELVAEVDAHVLDVCGRILVDRPDDPDMFRGGTARLFIEHPEVMDYLARVLPEGGATGAAIFDGLVTISATQGETFIARGLTRPDLDPVWSVLNPVLVRVAASVLRKQIERHLPAPLYSREQTVRWDHATTDLIRHGALKNCDGGRQQPRS
jgi:TetR/AcrR family transcriptional regulator, regulator of cefoperazone and chloramphenicol sensitivity